MTTNGLRVNWGGWDDRTLGTYKAGDGLGIIKPEDKPKIMAWLDWVDKLDRHEQTKRPGDLPPPEPTSITDEKKKIAHLNFIAASYLPLFWCGPDTQAPALVARVLPQTDDRCTTTAITSTLYSSLCAPAGQVLRGHRVLPPAFVVRWTRLHHTGLGHAGPLRAAHGHRRAEEAYWIQPQRNTNQNHK